MSRNLRDAVAQAVRLHVVGVDRHLPVGRIGQRVRRADGRVALERHFVFGFDDARGARERRGRVALDLGFVRRRGRGAAHVVEQLAGSRERRRRRRLPFGFQLPRGADGLLLALADHGHVVAAADDADEAGHVGHRRLVDALQRGARERRPHVARVDHAGQLHVHGPLQRAVHLGRECRSACSDWPTTRSSLHRLHCGLAGGRRRRCVR